MSASEERSPASQEIAEALRSEVAVMNDGDRLPTVRELMQRFNVSQVLIQRALNELKESGLISSQVGRGTFVGKRTFVAAERNVIILSRQGHPEGVEKLARTFYRQFSQRHCRTVILTYSDMEHALSILNEVSRFDACILQPRQSVIPISLLAWLRKRSQAIVVEGYTVEGVDIDMVAVDWPVAVEKALRHLIDLGHRQIGFVTQKTPLRAFVETARRFRTLCEWGGLKMEGDPVTLLSPDLDQDDLKRLRAKFDRAKQRQSATALIVFLSEGRLGRFRTMLKELDIRVPEDLSLVMLGPAEAHSDGADRLTVVGGATDKIGEAVIECIESHWQNRDAPYRSVYLEPVLLAGDTSRALGAIPKKTMTRRGGSA